MIAAAIATVVSGVAIFVAPGALVLAASRIAVARSEQLAHAFAASLALLAGTFAACLVFGLPIGAAPVVLGAVSAAVAAVLRWTATAVRVAPPPATPTHAPRAAVVVIALLVVLAIVAAVAFAPLGSIDRWWYLAYVRAWLERPVLSLAEPFLGSGEPFARFGVHPWLFGLALWSRLSTVDPVTIYERAAPILVVLASVSSARALAAALFGAGPRTRLTVIATMLLWSGALVPVLARAGEDKVLAAAALVPLLVATFLTLVQGGDRRLAWLLASAATATAAVHALAYAFALAVLVPAGALLLARMPHRRNAIAAAGIVLALVAVAPAASGFVVRERLDEIGATLGDETHPVVRVHEGRKRLLEIPLGGYVVRPALVAHPFALLAFLAWPLLRRRDNDDDVSMSPTTCTWLAVATLVPLTIAFVPPVPSVAGRVIPPWMVYRVLWMLPIAPLAAIAADILCRRFRHREAIATLALVAFALPLVAESASGRLAEARRRVALPRTGEFRELWRSVTALPADALIVAAPELAERLPALAARNVVAGLDRSTVVFSGSRERGEARLRARAALLAGDDDALALAAAAGIAPTHAIYDPHSADRPACGPIVLENSVYALCELRRQAASPPDVRPTLARIDDSHDARKLADAACEPRRTKSRRDPWSASAPVVRCRIALPDDLGGGDRLLLRSQVATGRATDEVRIDLDAANASLGSAATRVGSRTTIVLGVPPAAGAGREIEVRLESRFLPSIRPARIELATGGDAR